MIQLGSDTWVIKATSFKRTLLAYSYYCMCFYDAMLIPKIIWSLFGEQEKRQWTTWYIILHVLAQTFAILIVSSLVDILFIIYTMGVFQIPRPEIKPFYLAAVFLLSSPLSISLPSKWFCIMSYSWPLHVHLVEHVL